MKGDRGPEGGGEHQEESEPSRLMETIFSAPEMESPLSHSNREG